MTNAAVEWYPEELEALRPPEDIRISDWAERAVVLGGASGMKGPYRLDITPFFRPVMDVCQDQGVDEVVMCKPAQFGGTTCFACIVAYFAVEEQAPCMVVLADQLTSRYVATKRLPGLFRDSDNLRHLYNPNEFGQSEINLPNGAYIVMGWASSVAMMGTRDIRIVYGDEIDKPGYSLVTREAGPLDLMRERTDTYPEGFYKHLFSSTPTDEQGNVTLELMSCDIIYDWHVPCPHCGQFQPLRWDKAFMYGFEDFGLEPGMYRGADGKPHPIGGVVWDGGRKATMEQIAETARYACGECGSLWTTAEKNEAVRNGTMAPRSKPTGRDRKVGFHFNRIYSLFDGGKLEKMIERWCRIYKMGGEKKMKTRQGFINSTLAEPFKQVIVTSSEVAVLQARCELEAQTVPEEAVALTSFVDMQKRGFWFAVRAWARDYTSWLIHYGQLATWEDLEELFFETAYPIAGSEDALRIWRAAIDTGGGQGESGFSMTEEAYHWLRLRTRGRGCRVWGTKGSSRALAGRIHMGKPLDKTPSGKAIPGGLQIIQIDPNQAKDMVAHRLAQAREGGSLSAYLHKDTGEDYARQILAEEKQRTPKGVETWVQIKDDNHLLDCEAGCMVLAEPEWPGGGVNLIRGRAGLVTTGSMKPPPKAKAASAERRPNWQRSGGYKRPSWLNR